MRTREAMPILIFFSTLVNASKVTAQPQPHLLHHHHHLQQLQCQPQQQPQRPGRSAVSSLGVFFSIFLYALLNFCFSTSESTTSMTMMTAITTTSTNPSNSTSWIRDGSINVYFRLIYIRLMAWDKRGLETHRVSSPRVCFIFSFLYITILMSTWR